MSCLRKKLFQHADISTDLMLLFLNSSLVFQFLPIPWISFQNPQDHAWENRRCACHFKAIHEGEQGGYQWEQREELYWCTDIQATRGICLTLLTVMSPLDFLVKTVAESWFQPCHVNSWNPCHYSSGTEIKCQSLTVGVMYCRDFSIKITVWKPLSQSTPEIAALIIWDQLLFPSRKCMNSCESWLCLSF